MCKGNLKGSSSNAHEKDYWGAQLESVAAETRADWTSEVPKKESTEKGSSIQRS